MVSHNNELPYTGFGTGGLKGATAYNAVLSALACGYRLVDTAAMYGNEVEVGHAIRESGIPREDVVVITKGAHYEDEHGYRKTLDALDASLHRLGLSYVDYYLIHWPVNQVMRGETWRAMEHLQEAGKASLIGVSNYSVRHLRELGKARVQPAVNQIEFHPFIYYAQQEILEYCRQHGIKLIGYATLAGGQADNNETINAIANRLGRPYRQILARWSMQHGVTPLVRSASPEHIADNFIVDDFEIGQEDMRLIDNLHGVRLFPDPYAMP